MLEHMAPGRSQWTQSPDVQEQLQRKGIFLPRDLQWSPVCERRWKHRTGLCRLLTCSFTKPAFSASVSPSRVPICLSAGQQIGRATLLAHFRLTRSRSARVCCYSRSRTQAQTPALTPPLPPESSGPVFPRSLSPAALPLKAACTLERGSGVKWGGEGIQD